MKIIVLIYRLLDKLFLVLLFLRIIDANVYRISLYLASVRHQILVDHI